MSDVVIVTSYDGTQSVVGPFRSEKSAYAYAKRTEEEGLDAQVTPLERP
jgi:hypothetical protein